MPLVTISQTLAESVKKAGVFPDVIDEFPQKALIQASYPNGDQVKLGNELQVADTQVRPEVQLTFNESTKGKSYTLAVTDPDAPRRGDPTWSEFVHYLVSGIKPEVAEGESHKVDFSKATEHISYMGPGPPAKTALHRYVFLLFEEGSGITVKGLPSENRPNWGTGKPGSGVRDWLKGQNLTPVAINFFVAKNLEQ